MKTIRCNEISKRVYELAVLSGADSYPVNLRDILSPRVLSKYKIEAATFEDFERFVPSSNEIFKTSDGASVYFPEADLFLLFYNSKIYAQARINWTIAHEMGHIIMRHAPEGISGSFAEREADCFAKLLLCHPLIIKNCEITSHTDIQKLCAISKLAAKNREAELKSSPSYNKWDWLIAERFTSFSSRKKCTSCQTICTCPAFEGTQALYCGNCGSDIFEKSVKVFTAKIPKVKTSKCPVCENSDLTESRFCKICGFNLQNPCTVCEKPTYTVAKFCPYCAGKTQLSAIYDSSISISSV
ncbi:MAG: hypothetical protein LBS21_10805 [Clostridiales bacterium]|jgi:hypothetical protein|nr:hypothetical protein [Clostridiales bacterium]